MIEEVEHLQDLIKAKYKSKKPKPGGGFIYDYGDKGGIGGSGVTDISQPEKKPTADSEAEHKGRQALAMLRSLVTTINESKDKQPMVNVAKKVIAKVKTYEKSNYTGQITTVIGTLQKVITEFDKKVEKANDANWLNNLAKADRKIYG